MHRPNLILPDIFTKDVGIEKFKISLVSLGIDVTTGLI